MEKEQYNIDDILSEVKKHREEQERLLRGEEPVKEEADELVGDTEPVNEHEPEFTLETDTAEEESEPITAELDEVEQAAEFEEFKESEELEVQEIEKEVEPEAEPEVEDDTATDELINIFDITEPEKQEEEKETKKPKKNKKKIIKDIILVVLIIICVAGIVGALFLNHMLNNVAEDEDDNPYDAVTYYDGMDFLQEDFPLIEEASAYDIYGYKDYLKNWYQNGDPVRSTHVLNVLLIGEDTREENISNTSRADSSIIASINIDTGVIHMTSVLRDLYVYYEVDGEGYYGKINESASMGGINTYIKTLERTYKIAIDGYAVINFANFPKLIDALGGVEINITDAEINEINNHPRVYDDVGEVYIEKTFEGNEGMMKLDGKQALAYCRIRHIDSDFARADRQKYVLSVLLDKVRNSNTWDAVKAVNQLSKYTKTSYSKSELISIGNLALRDGWLNYQIQQTNVPTEENRLGDQYFSVSYNNWIWLADIPKDASELQTAIYGKSNIKLNEQRADYISMGR